MATYEQLEELIAAHKALAEARAEAARIVEVASERRRAAAVATGMGPSELARELGLTPTNASDLLKAAEKSKLPLRRRPALTDEQKAARLEEKRLAKFANALAAVEAPVLNLVAGAESGTAQKAVTVERFTGLEDVVLLDLEPRTAQAV